MSDGLTHADRLVWRELVRAVLAWPAQKGATAAVCIGALGGKAFKTPYPRNLNSGRAGWFKTLATLTKAWPDLTELQRAVGWPELEDCARCCEALLDPAHTRDHGADAVAFGLAAARPYWIDDEEGGK